MKNRSELQMSPGADARTIEAKFVAELELFRNEADTAISAFYAALAINGYPHRRRKVLAAMNEAALFWMTVRASLMSSTWIALGRIFDNDSPHNIAALFRIVERHRDMFSKAALGARKSADSPNAEQWLSDYLARAHVPTVDEIRRLKRHIKRNRAIYEARYKNIRDKIHAHRALSGAEASALFGGTTIGEVERLLTFLKKLYNTLWEMFYNGWRPVLRPIPYSANRMVNRHDSKMDRNRNHVQREVVKDSVLVMRALTAGIDEILASDRKKAEKRAARLRARRG